MIIDRWHQNALKGQFILARGNALGKKRHHPRPPCKGSLKQWHKEQINNLLPKYKHMKRP